MKQETAGNKLT